MTVGCSLKSEALLLLMGLWMSCLLVS